VCLYLRIPVSERHELNETRCVKWSCMVHVTQRQTSVIKTKPGGWSVGIPKKTINSFKQQHRQCTYYIALTHVRLTIVTMKGNNYYIFWVCVYILALVIQHEKRMRHVMVSCVACLALQHFCQVIWWTTRFWEKESYWSYNVCFDFLYVFCLKQFSF